MTLPRPARASDLGLLVVTDRRQAAAPLPEVIEAAVAGGARRVLLREKDLPDADRRALADRLRAILAGAGGDLIVAGSDPLGGDAVHLPAAGPVPAGPDRPALVGRSCHNAAELSRLTSEDYVTLSPIYPSGSKPGYGPALTPAGLAGLCARTDRPVLALGGVETPAVMGAVMRSPDPAATVAALRAAVTVAALRAGVAR